MDQDKPAAGEEYNPGPPTEPRQAASVILVRGEEDGLELLLVKRNPAARFMGGVWVFPGGAVDLEEGAGEEPHRTAGVRELLEEAGIAGVTPDDLVPFSRWITPAQVRTRFDTWFFVAHLPEGQEAQVDGAECVEAGWFTPQGALDAHRRGEILLVFPTIKHLEQLRGFASARELLRHASEREVLPVEPRVVVAGETARVLLPEDPGYDAA